MHPRPKILGLCLVASTIAAAAQTVTTSGGTTNTVPLFTGKTTIGNSIITQSDDHVGIGTKTPAATLDVDGATIFRNTLTALSGNATSSATVNSPIFILSGSAYNSSSKAAVTQKFGWQTVPNGNDTSAPSANLKLFFGTGTESLAQTGFAISSKGLITFAPGQTFPGGTGTGTITKVTAGTGLTGGGSSGAVTLNVDSTKVPLLATSNTFAGSNKFTALQTFEQSVTGLQGFVGENSQSGFVALEGDDYSNSGVGVRGLSYNQGSGYDGYGGIFEGYYGVYADGELYAGDFDGDVYVSGTLSKAGGSFKIDHPLDPQNKYLSHSFVESPDMMNIYNGNVTTDNAGSAVVTMPDYFESLNRDFRYQLTVIGQFAQAIVASEVADGKFTIRTDKPNVKVSWQVTGVRQDAWANAHRIPVEEEKAAKDKSHYLHPELFGHPDDLPINALPHHRDVRANQTGLAVPHITSD